MYIKKKIFMYSFQDWSVFDIFFLWKTFKVGSAENLLPFFFKDFFISTSRSKLRKSLVGNPNKFYRIISLKSRSKLRK